MGGVALHQVKLPLAGFQHRVVGDLAPLVVVRPTGHLQAHRAGQVVRRAQVVHVVVQPDLVSVLDQVARAGLHPGDVHAQPVVAV